jgi:hypothetical protein
MSREIAVNRGYISSRSFSSSRGSASNRGLTVAFIPIAPTNVTATATSPVTITVSWTDTNTGGASYKIEQSLNGTSGWSLVGTTLIGATSFGDSGLTASTAYFYRVRGSNINGESSPSSNATATTQGVPMAPSNLVATAVNSSQINLTWTDNSNNETGFVLERSLDGISGWSSIATPVANVASASDTGLSGSTQYFYRIKAVNAGGSSSYSSTANATTTVGPPAAPSNLVATSISSSEIDLTWTDNSGNETGFIVERTTDQVNWAALIATAANATSYSDTSCASSTQYYYRVRATNAGGDSANSSTASALTTSGPGPFLLLQGTNLTNTQAKASGNTTQWQAFKTRLDAELNNVTVTGYQGDALTWAGDFALGYQTLKTLDPTTAAKYADKAIAVLKYGMRGGQRSYQGTREYLARGDGSTTVFNLPHTDNINASTFKVWTASVSIATITNHVANSQTESFGGFDSRVIKVSNTSDGTADYTERTISNRHPVTLTTGDWGQNPLLRDDYIDWSGATNQPASGATYYVTWVDPLNGTLVSETNYTLDTVNGTLTFNVAPGANSAILVEYQYGTFTSGATTLGYQQTCEERCGFNNIFIDTGYTSRYLGAFTALAFDWLYEYSGYSTDLKAETAYILKLWSDQVRDNGYYKDNPTSNYCAGHYVSRVLTAIALKERGDANGPSLLTEIKTYRTANTIPQVMDAPAAGSSLGTYKGGFWGEGWNYGPLAVRNILMAALALENDGQVTPTKEKTWAGEVILALLHGQPSNADIVVNSTHYQGTIHDAGDGYAYPLPVPGKDLYYLAAAASSDAQSSQYANFFIQEVIQPQVATMQDLLYRDPSAIATDWTTVLSPHYLASGTGVVYARNAWDYASLWLAFQCGNLVSADHQSDAQGDLHIQRGADDLLVNANAVTENQVVGGETLDKKSVFANLVAVDDGGTGLQNYPYAQGFWQGSPGNILLQYEGVSGYVYTAGDYKAAYSLASSPGDGGSVSTLQRSVFYVRPDIVVVYDRVVLKTSSCAARLQWHSIANPTVTGDSFTVSRGSSKLFGTIVSRSALTTSGTQLTINGSTSWTPTGSGETYSVYRVSSVLTTPTLSQRFCTVLQTASSGTSSAYSVDRLVTGSDFEGAIVNGNTVVLFGQTAGPVSTSGGKSYSYTGTNGQTITHYITDLNPSQSYTLSGVASGTVSASTAGVITFTTTGNGSPQIVTIT